MGQRSTFHQAALAAFDVAEMLFPVSVFILRTIWSGRATGSNPGTGLREHVAVKSRGSNQNCRSKARPRYGDLRINVSVSVSRERNRIRGGHHSAARTSANETRTDTRYWSRISEVQHN